MPVRDTTVILSKVSVVFGTLMQRSGTTTLKLGTLLNYFSFCLMPDLFLFDDCSVARA
jgi:hypothetical protein